MSEREFDPRPLLAALIGGGVDFVLIGGLAATAHGSSYPTYDLDIAYSRQRENLERMATVLRQLGAELRGAPAGLPFQLDARTLENGANFTFQTQFGSLDILGDPAGAPPYEQLAKAAQPEEIGGIQVPVVALDHLIAMKKAAGRQRDLMAVSELQTISDELRAPRLEP